MRRLRVMAIRTSVLSTARRRRRFARSFRRMSPHFGLPAEMFDPNDRRLSLSVHHCTNCGPRFTIIRDIPYDRPSTSMAMFSMCRHVLRIRESAGPPLPRPANACWDCGPRVELLDNLESESNAAIHRRSGLQVARRTGRRRQGPGGFHLAVDATNPAAVALCVSEAPR